MTVSQLIQELSKYPASTDVYLAERKTEFAFGLVNSTYSKEITFSEDEGGEPISKDTVVILDEE